MDGYPASVRSFNESKVKNKINKRTVIVLSFCIRFFFFFFRKLITLMDITGKPADPVSCTLAGYYIVINNYANFTELFCVSHNNNIRCSILLVSARSEL